MSQRSRSLASFSFSDVNPIALGIVTIALVVAASTFAFAVGSLGILDSTYTMSGVFESSGGIRTDDKVRYAGVEIGRVTDVRADFEEGRVVVTWEVDSSAEIGHGARAEIALATLLGGRYLRIAGPVEEPLMADLDVEDRRIPLERTRVPLGVTDALGQATTAIDAIDAGQIDELVNQLADLSIDNADAFQPLLEDVSSLTGTLATRRDTIDALLDETNRLTATLADKDQALVHLIDEAGKLLDAMAQRREQFSALLGSGSAAVTELDALITRNRAALDNILGDLHTTTQTLEPKLPELNETLAVLGPALASLETSVQSGPWIDIQVFGLGILQLGDILRSGMAE